MNIGKPTKELPAPRACGKYAEVWKQFDALPPGEWLPVEFETQDEARVFASSARGRRAKLKIGMEIKGRGNIAYISKKGTSHA